MWATNFKEERSARIKEILELTTFVLSAEIANYLMVNRLKVLSSRDMLTGVMNRNEMNIYVDRLVNLPAGQTKSVGIIFTDLNGLKRTNDIHGHSAGDRLLRNAASALSELFDTRNIFRAGGDEFVVVLEAVTQDRTEEMAKAIYLAEQHYPGLSFSVGWSFEEDCRDVRRALTQADQRMYEDKKRYYLNREK